jgi:hypothetical protein
VAETRADALVKAEQDPVSSAPVELFLSCPVSSKAAAGHDCAFRGFLSRRSDTGFECQSLAQWSLPVTQDALRREDMAVINEEARGERPHEKTLGYQPDG